MKPTFKAYAAGFLDADGCIAITYDKRGYYKVSVQIVQKYYLDLFDELIEHFGGSVHEDTKYNKYRYQLVSQQARKFLLKVVPYMRCKRDQAILAIVYLGIMREAESLRERVKSGSIRYPDEIYDFQKYCHALLQDWKKTPPTETEREERKLVTSYLKTIGMEALEDMRKRQSVPVE